MTTAIATRNGSSGAAVFENVVIKGDLSRLSEGDRSSYYMAVCNSVGLNPLTQPFAYITLNGKLTLYALRNCTDQLRSIHKISVVDMSETERDGVMIVTCKVSNADGRTDIAKGAVNLASLKGEALANAIMKAETKAKRRATLSICGLGMLDETEIADIPKEAKGAPKELEVIGMDGEEGASDIKTVAEARPVYDRLERELKALTTDDDVIAWGNANKKTIDKFRYAWKNQMYELYRQQREDIRNGAPPGPGKIVEVRADAPPTEGNRFLRWVDMTLGEVDDPGMLEPNYAFRIAPNIPKGSEEETQALLRKHEQRLGA